MRVRRQAEVAAADVGMRVREFGDHLAEHVVEIGAVADVGEQRLVLGAQGVPVVAVHVRHVEVIAVAAPDLAEDLGVFGLGLDQREQAVGADALGLRFCRLEIDRLVRLVVADQHGAAIGGERQIVDAREHVAALAFLERPRLQGGLERPLAAVVRRVADHVQDGLPGHRDPGDVVRIDRRARDALVDAIEVDVVVDFGGRLGLFLRGLVALVGGLVGLGLVGVLVVLVRGAVVARRKRIVDALAQRDGENAGIAVGGVIPFDVGQLRRPLAVAEEIEVFAVRRERRRGRVEARIAHAARSWSR